MSYEQLATAVDNLAVVNLALADEVRNTQSTFEASELAAVNAASTAVAAKDVTVAAKDVAVAASNNATAKEALATAAATSADQSETNAAVSAAAASASEATAIANADISTTNKDQAVAAKVAAEAARDVAQDAAASLVGVITDRGPIDLSGGVYPPAQTTSSMWKVTVAGTVDGIQYGVGDTLMFTLANDSFYKIDNTEQVSSVAGKTGAVLLDKVDVGLDLVDNTPDVSKPISSPQQTALNAKIDKTSIVDDLTSTDATKVLSAKQGKSLYDLIQANNVTLVVYEFLATAGQTVFSGVDANGLTLLYTAGTGTIVLRNGVQLEKTVDYTATDGSSVTFVTTNDLNDLIQVMAFGTFSVANHYTKAEDDALLLTKANKASTDAGFADRYTKAEDDARFVQKTAIIDAAHGGTGATSMGAGAVGAVTQSGGVPTGAVVERTYNATTGERTVRWADGTQMSQRTISVSVTMGTASGSMYTHAGEYFLPANFDRPFAEAPNVHDNYAVSSWYGWSTTTTLQTATQWPGIKAFSVANPGGAVTITNRLTAWGRWF